MEANRQVSGEAKSVAWTVFEYLYRDANNHKAFGKAVFEGAYSSLDWEAALDCFEEGLYFIAEQIGLPAIYNQLLRWSGNAPTDADHCWHEFISITNTDAVPLDAKIFRAGSAKDFIERVVAIENWDILKSPIVEHQCRNSPSG